MWPTMVVSTIESRGTVMLLTMEGQVSQKISLCNEFFKGGL